MQICATYYILQNFIFSHSCQCKSQHRALQGLGDCQRVKSSAESLCGLNGEESGEKKRHVVGNGSLLRSLKFSSFTLITPL